MMNNFQTWYLDLSYKEKVSFGEGPISSEVTRLETTSSLTRYVKNKQFVVPRNCFAL